MLKAKFCVSLVEKKCGGHSEMVGLRLCTFLFVSPKHAESCNCNIPNKINFKITVSKLKHKS
jgi:hypothetical protein